MSSGFRATFKHKFMHIAGSVVGLLLFVTMLWVLHRALQQYHYRDILLHIRTISVWRLALALLLTLLNYLVLTGHDALAFRYLQYGLSCGKIALASFLGYAFSHNVGFSLLSSVSVRYRLYTTWGLSAGEIATVVAFNGITFWFGVLALGGLSFIWEPIALPASLHLPMNSLPLLGSLLLALVAGYLVLSTVRKTPIEIRQWQVGLPPFKLALAQVVLSSLDWALAAGVLYVLLPTAPTLSYPMFLGIFAVAQIAGVSSQVPGGIGVMETLILVVLAPVLPAPAVLGSLLVYRAIYYLMPLAFAVVLLAAHEVAQRRQDIDKLTRAFGRWVPVLAPQLLAISTFVGGAVLLFSGATPAVHSRLAWLHAFLPLPVIEVSHFLGSLVGLGLLLLARGLQQRLDAAYHLTLQLLAIGITLSLLKGFDYEEAGLLFCMFLVLWPCQDCFYRKAALLSERFSRGLIMAISVVILGSIWLGMFAHKHVDYAHDLWWHFALKSDAPRFMRATVGIVAGIIAFALARLLRPAPPEPTVPTPDALAQALDVTVQTGDIQGNLALLGDKALMFHERGNAFIMYAVEGRSWIALGDPIGPEPERTELAWQFCERCDAHNGWPVFYEVDYRHMPLYIDLGLTLFKLGEEAHVDLKTFSIRGEPGKNFRHILNRTERDGSTFAIVPAADVPALLPELRAVSDAWLAEKHVREKGFSLGYFDPLYLSHFPMAIVRQGGEPGNIIAFSNLWLGADKAQLAPDLMRYIPNVSYSVMDYLFLRLMLWGQQEGYAWCNLGMAPLSGLEDHVLAPLWTRLGSLVFRHGEHFYNFQGLRQYKEKFDPVWEPRYLAAPGGLVLPRILTNIAVHISGGIRGVIAK
jgi:phosphatidylglycerol lysyltransferase